MRLMSVLSRRQHRFKSGEKNTIKMGNLLLYESRSLGLCLSGIHVGAQRACRASMAYRIVFSFDLSYDLAQ